MDNRIDTIPEGYSLYAYDDCGVEGRQPHVRMEDSYCWTFNTSDTDADIKSRSAVFSYKQVVLEYNDLNPKLSYALALTYASDHVYNRVQSLWADGIQLHAPLALPKAKAIKVVVKVPEEVTLDGKMRLELKIHGEVNATISIAELWANAPSPQALRINGISAGTSELSGCVMDLTWEPVYHAVVRLVQGGKTIATSIADKDGFFHFRRSLFKSTGPFRIETQHGEVKGVIELSKAPEFFDPVHYRPIPARTAGLKKNRVSLDGIWKISPEPGITRDICVPGQWLQQGFDIPQDKPVGMSREFEIPADWKSYRVFLRFDSIHAGTRYRLNGKELGTSENLYTPVEWDITDSARFGEVNRLDLEMLVSTESERLSYSSGYAFHNLGGIDRSVSIYALPMTHIRRLRIDAGLDKTYRNGELKLDLAVENPSRQGDLILLVSVGRNKSRLLEKSVTLKNSSDKENTLSASFSVPNPLKWSAEKPNLYDLVLELRDGRKVLERIERKIGFRKIELRESQLYVNGVRVKLAGACRHEIDPLTGRADTMRHAEEDVRLIKEANLNYIRTAHYPPTKELLDAADRLGMYLEVEAPFCWVGPSQDMSNLQQILTPTSMMVDYCHSHPSVILWSIANESAYNPAFEVSNALVKSLDTTRPTTFNNPDPKRVSDIGNLHYPPMPYDNCLGDDPRPFLLGEYFFPICHEQTDVRINPGLRELWAAGHAEPDSEWGRACAASFDQPHLKPGAKPGAWSHIYHSKRIIGGAIWAAFDEPFYLPGGKHCGYAWVHGFWGLIDAWRRPKPEWWLSKLMFSPVWFPTRHVDFTPGQRSVSVPVENRYSFTDLSELKFVWQIGNQQGVIKPALAPGSTGIIRLPVPAGTKPGDRMILRITDAGGTLINALAIHLGKQKPEPLPAPSAGAPENKNDKGTITITGNRFHLSFFHGELISGSPILRFPKLHVTRYDFGDLAGPNSAPYAVLPDESTRAVEEVTVGDVPEGLEIVVKDHYTDFKGSIRWLIDKNGTSRIFYDYTYTGEEMNAREIGIRLLLPSEYDELSWKRWSEWDIFPEDSISRTEGRAKALRDGKGREDPEGVKPTWLWSQDQTELGTNDFRSVKFNVYEASLTAPNGSGVRLYANADAHLRACLSPDGVQMHLLSQCRLGQIVIKKGDRLSGEFAIQMF